MKKYLLKILLFFGIVAVADIGFGLVCKYMVDNAHSGETARINGVLKKNHYDVMIMGSSRCVCHYDDKMMSDSLGLDVVNAGEKGNGIVLMYGRYCLLPKSNKPKVLIYDVEPAFDAIQYENDDHNHRYLEGMKFFYDEPRIKEIFKNVDFEEPIKMSSCLYRYNSRFVSIASDYLKRGKVEYSCYLPNNKEYVSPLKRKPEQERAYDSLKLHYFEQLILDTKSDDVKLIVVASPKYGASSMRDLEPIVELCHNYEIPFWDYYYDMHDTCWFCDNMHLNYVGSQAYTKEIIRRLQEEEILK